MNGNVIFSVYIAAIMSWPLYDNPNKVLLLIINLICGTKMVQFGTTTNVEKILFLRGNLDVTYAFGSIFHFNNVSKSGCSLR